MAAECVIGPDWTAIVQALGTLLAVGVAIWVPWKQRKDQIERDDSIAAAQLEKENAERSVRARSLVTLLYPDVVELGYTINAVAGATMLSAARINIPPRIITLVNDLYLIGEDAARPVQQLASLCGWINRRIEEVRARPGDVGFSEHLEMIRPRLKIAEALAKQADLCLEGWMRREGLWQDE